MIRRRKRGLLKEKDENSIVAVRNASGHQGENERQLKRQTNTCEISSIKFVTNKSHVLVVQNKSAKKCAKKCAARAKLLLLLFF